jgi:hypothetical protein
MKIQPIFGNSESNMKLSGKSTSPVETRSLRTVPPFDVYFSPPSRKHFHHPTYTIYMKAVSMPDNHCLSVLKSDKF